MVFVATVVAGVLASLPDIKRLYPHQHDVGTGIQTTSYDNTQILFWGSYGGGRIVRRVFIERDEIA